MKNQIESEKAESNIVCSKKQALEDTFAKIDRQFGKGSVMFLGMQAFDKIKVISTGSMLIDNAIGVGGFPRGRIIEIFGHEASGKTTLTLQAIAQAQKNGGTCVFVDAEHAMDPSYAANIGIDTKNLIISQPDYGEQALEIVDMFIRSNAIDMIVVDSVAALIPKAELDGEMKDIHVGLQARLMSKALRKLTAAVGKSKTILIFINQIRSKISSFSFGNNETTSGGNALKFYSSVRMEVKRVAQLKKDDKIYGNKISVKIVKNKVAAPFKKVEVDIIFGRGINRDMDLLDFALICGIIKQAGSWFLFGAEKIAQGRDNCLKRFNEDIQLCNKIKEIIIKKDCKKEEKE